MWFRDQGMERTGELGGDGGSERGGRWEMESGVERVGE